MNENEANSSRDDNGPFKSAKNSVKELKSYPLSGNCCAVEIFAVFSGQVQCYFSFSTFTRVKFFVTTGTPHSFITAMNVMKKLFRTCLELAKK